MDMVMLIGTGVVHLTLRVIREERRRRHLKSAFVAISPPRWCAVLKPQPRRRI